MGKPITDSLYREANLPARYHQILQTGPSEPHEITNEDMSRPLFTILLLLLFSRRQIKADREEQNNQKQRAALGILSKAGRENCLRWVYVNNTGQTPLS